MKDTVIYAIEHTSDTNVRSSMATASVVALNVHVQVSVYTLYTSTLHTAAALIYRHLTQPEEPCGVSESETDRKCHRFDLNYLDKIGKHLNIVKRNVVQI